MAASEVRHNLPGWGLWGVACAILAFLYVPVIVIVVHSFNASRIASFPIVDWTNDWYGTAIHDEVIVQAARNSLIVATVSIAISLAVGIPAAFALDRFDFPGKGLFARILFVPFLFPGIVTGIMLVTVFINAGVDLSLKTVIAGHVSLLIPLTTVLMAASLQRWDRALEAAAMDLGANELRTFAHVIVPNLRSTLAGIVLLSLTFSLDEVTRTFFLAGTDSTLPMAIWAMLRRGITPEVNAVATMVLCVSLLTIGIWARLSRDVL